MPLEAKMASGKRDRGVAYAKVFDWLLISMHVDSAWAQQTPVIMKAHDDLTFNVIGATMGGPSQNPLACLYKPRVCGNKAELLRLNPSSLWLSLACWGAGLADSRLTSPWDPSALLRKVPLPLSFCGAPPAVKFFRRKILNNYLALRNEPTLLRPTPKVTKGSQEI